MKPMQIPREQKLIISEGIQHYFQMEFGQEIGQLAAENFMDYMLKELSPYVYNQALADARQVMEQKLASLDDELYALEQRILPDRR
ncbi:DUF2164 domain-containing protein [Paenibacillus sp. JX-17]|uniref:DUF2164 domain-containing protein n=1 Tax=Paenibacillus lacisoli TaxID=3064525 RepID=A0ABT9CCL1_9BACL|nr:DUF2164 domain-containing protein [Paenibacillus sp. JX-17]MDO7907008.1 DUF2164 domain-containing protein [Paenibacillus sp. JX-17]